MTLPTPLPSQPIVDREGRPVLTFLQFLRDVLTRPYRGYQQTIDPDDPAPGEFVIWMADGTGAGDAGDILVKITDAAGTTKTTTLLDFDTL